MRTSKYQTIEDCTEFRRLTHTRVPKLLHGTALILLLLIGIGIVWAAKTEANLVVTSQGRVRAIADESQNWEELTTDIASETGGQVKEVLVDVGQTVSKGDVLVRFETQRLENSVEQLQQNLLVLENELNQLNKYDALAKEQAIQDEARAQAELDEAISEAGKANAQRDSQIRIAVANLTEATSHFERNLNLHRQNAIADSELDQARTRKDLAIESLAQSKLLVSDKRIDVLQKSLRSVQTGNATRQQELEIRLGNKRGEIEAARLKIDGLQFDLRRAAVVAVADGVITDVSIKQGDFLHPGKVGISTVRQDELAMIMNLTSDDVGNLKPGMKVRVRLDSYDFRDYGVAEGTVRLVSPDSQVQQGPNGQQLAAYQVTVVLDAHQVAKGPLVGQIRMGMTGTAEIVVERKTLLALFLRKIRNTISLT